MDKKIVKSVALGIVIGCLTTYFLIYFLQLSGVINQPIRDDWGAVLSLLVVLIGWVSVDNRRVINSFKKVIDENSAKDQETIKWLNSIDRRLIRIETKFGIDDERF